MKINRPLILLGTLLGANAINAHATTTAYASNGANLVYSSVSDVTWTQDANLLGTLETNLGYTNAIDAIIAANPTIYDTANSYDTPANSGQHIVTAADFSAGGYASWFGAQAFVGYLNSISYGNSTQWRLPTSNAIYGFDGSAGNELGQLVYGELGGTAGTAIPDTSVFNNEQAYWYWSGTEYAFNPSFVWNLNTVNGNQEYGGKNTQYYAWAVSSGQIVAAPIPAAAWLFGPALLTLLGFNKRVGGGQA